MKPGKGQPPGDAFDWKTYLVYSPTWEEYRIATRDEDSRYSWYLNDGMELVAWGEDWLWWPLSDDGLGP